MLAILPLLLGLLAGCGGSGSATTTVAAPSEAASRSGGADSRQILALQSAAEASLRHQAGDAYELTMTKPNEKTLYFTDSPGRHARRAPARALPAWLRAAEEIDGTSPNATVTWPEATGGMPGSMVARLAGASYRQADGSLHFSLRSLRLASGEPATVGTDPLGAAPLPRGPATVVIDGTAARSCQLSIEPRTEEERTLNLESSELDHGEWSKPPPASITLHPLAYNHPVAQIEAESDGFMTGCEFLVRYGDGKGNWVELGVDSPFVEDASYTHRCTGNIGCEVAESGSVGDLAVNLW